MLFALVCTTDRKCYTKYPSKILIVFWYYDKILILQCSQAKNKTILLDTEGVFRSLCILLFCVFGMKSSIFEVLNID